MPASMAGVTRSDLKQRTGESPDFSPSPVEPTLGSWTIHPRTTEGGAIERTREIDVRCRDDLGSFAVADQGRPGPRRGARAPPSRARRDRGAHGDDQNSLRKLP